MESIVVSNIKQRPTRTAVSIIGVALGVVLVVVVAGLVNGMQRERGKRESNLGAELQFRRDFSLTATSVLSLPIQYRTKLEEIPGVALTSPVGQYLKQSNSGIGLEFLDGIEYSSYEKMANLKIVKGMPLTDELDVIVDEHYARDKRVGVGDRIDMLNRKFRISGIYTPETGSRIKISLSTMQKLMAAPERCTLIYVKCVNSEDQDTVARRIDAALPGNKIIFLRDIPKFYERGIPAFNTFLKVVINLAVIFSLLVVMLAMYTTITERTREIGILKSLGASKSFIIREIEQEALLICSLGVGLGYVVSFLLQFGISRLTSLQVEIEMRWLFYAAIIGLSSGLLGALYPALRAAGQDPIKALSYE